MQTPAVVVDDLHVRYGDVQAVDGMSWQVERGTITAVLGPNGAGKTTTIEACEGFRRPQRGAVRVLGLDPRTQARALHPRIGVMLQHGGAWSGARPVEMLDHIAALHAHPLDVPALVERLGLAISARTPCRRLSGGQQQRLSLAMALVGRPELVFLDEPTSGLDPHARRATWQLLEELRDAGVTVVLTTHFMDEAERLADMVHVVDSGRLVASGTPDQLTASSHEDTIHFVARPGLDLAQLRAALPLGTVISETAPGRYVVSGGVGPQLLATLTAWCAAQDLMPERLAVHRPSLEDVFLGLTGQGLE